MQRAHVRRKLWPGLIIAGIALSPRELECLYWAAQGKSRWETGQILSLSERTVKFHLDNTREKLGVATLAQAVCLMARHATCNLGNH